MNQRTLAKALRRRQLRQGLAPKSSIHALPDHEIIDAYLRCAKCHLDLFSSRDAAVRNARTAEEFVELVEMAIASHRCPVSN